QVRTTRVRGRVAVERTLILAKPDAVERSLAGEILARFERRGFKVRAARLLTASRETGETHYAEHSEKPFFGELVDFITSGPTLALVLEGDAASETCRKTIGATTPPDADPGSLRGEFALAMPNNLVHGSDSPESAEREIGLWFPAGLAGRRGAPPRPRRALTAAQGDPHAARHPVRGGAAGVRRGARR